MDSRTASTLLPAVGIDREEWPDAPIVEPLVMSSIFEHGAYGRRANPNRRTLAAALAELEGADEAFVFPSGMSAIHVAIEVLDVDRLIVPYNLYGGVYELLTRSPRRDRIEVAFADYDSPDELDRLLEVGVRTAVWVETITNPLATMPDVASIAGRAHAAGARVVVDNTFATPYLYRPLSDGADIVIESATKYLAGHSDVILGVLAVSDSDLAHGARYYQESAGLIPSPFDCWLTSRGMRTLAARLDRQWESAARIAVELATWDAVTAVHHPGRGAVVSFAIGDDDAGQELTRRTKLWRLAASLGGVESTIAHPATMSHRTLVADGVARLPAGLVRLSVGLEDPRELLDDLRTALTAVNTSRTTGRSA